MPGLTNVELESPVRSFRANGNVATIPIQSIFCRVRCYHLTPAMINFFSKNGFLKKNKKNTQRNNSVRHQSCQVTTPDTAQGYNKKGLIGF